jgi:rRNA processing protein Gar1
MQNEPHESKADHTSFYVISKLFTQTFLIGRGNATFLYIAYVKSTKNVGKLTCVFGRFKNPFFLWLIQILKAVTMVMVTAIAFLVIYAQPSHISHDMVGHKWHLSDIIKRFADGGRRHVRRCGLRH